MWQELFSMQKFIKNYWKKKFIKNYQKVSYSKDYDCSKVYMDWNKLDGIGTTFSTK